MKTDVLYGIHSVREAIKAGRRKIFKVYVSERRTSKRIDTTVGLAESRNISVQRVSPETLRRTAGVEHHQGICATVSAYPFVEISQILNSFYSEPNPPAVLLVDHMVDPQNLGALIRTALCVGMGAVFIPRDRSASPTAAVSKASAGALEHIRMCKVTNMIHAIRTLKHRGLWIVGLDHAAEASIYTTDLKVPLGMVVGGEEKGIRSLVKRHCDILVSIPQAHTVNSLNASVAGAVAMYEMFRQRHEIEPIKDH
ncbi:MAG: 23S rRNA (guanosine(2251)-2'-O)-methyltransferase RlmB [Deltaproteobacteria bacterium]|nr:23S rRNA (guanosine(2251)-2'-O)-methyltransferase RlmB [Deltaproteobacteria bacterium]MBW2154022.1 23S rRNA (guanosine(2251)-2'-O)-methyltransferase RlmB [Deltaproteobacteria bacterium]